MVIFCECRSVIFYKCMPYFPQDVGLNLQKSDWLEYDTEHLLVRAGDHTHTMTFARMAFSCFFSLALARDNERCSSSDDVRIVLNFPECL